MSILYLIFLIFSVSWQQPRLAAGQEECQPTSCNPSGPIIRFPFRIEARQPDRCGYPGFDLSCNRTEFQFQFPVRASARNVVLPISARATVQEIDYTNQVIRMSVVKGSCLPDRVPEARSSPSPSPFEFYNKMMQAWDTRFSIAPERSTNGDGLWAPSVALGEGISEFMHTDHRLPSRSGLFCRDV